MLTISNIGNCNVSYVTGLRGYLNKPEEAMKYLLTAPRGYGYNNHADAPPNYRIMLNGIYVFAQGSEDPISTQPYARQFKELIDRDGLALEPVFESGPAKNVQHYNKPGYFYVWVINKEACRNWFNKHVLGKEPLEPLLKKPRAVRKKKADIKAEVEQPKQKE